MLQAAPFTPQQLLDAGRRAEAEGKLDFAAQFYRHLTDHYAYTSEAAEARSGLGRIGAVQQQVWHSPANGAATHANGAAPPAYSNGRSSHARPGQRRPVPHRDYYRVGRALAGLFSAAGWASVALGCAVPVLLFVVGVPRAYGMHASLGAAAGLVVVGLFAVFSGQAARALFDQANATRELVALERAKIGHE